MALSMPRSAGASPEEQEAMFTRHRARVASEAEIFSTPKHSKAAATEKPSPSQPLPAFCHPSRCHAPPSDQEEMMTRFRARVGGSEASEADWEAMRSRSERRQRAWDAHVKSSSTPNRRATRLPPKPSHQYCPALSTTPVRDQRLSPGAVRTLVLIRAVLGRDSGRIITRKYLAKTLGYSERTAQRHLSILRQFGYITTTLVNAPNGRILGQRIRVTSAARPFWQGEGPDVSPLKGFPINGASEDWLDPAAFAKGFASKGRFSTPERKPPSG